MGRERGEKRLLGRFGERAWLALLHCWSWSFGVHKIETNRPLPLEVVL
jgi:hypothetical protein